MTGSTYSAGIESGSTRLAGSLLDGPVSGDATCLNSYSPDFSARDSACLPAG
ncbi:MAG: hypothetical protein JWN08_3841 [Frankiales bacterium]|nr:hypothetical protein [Frankiales bacterium]